MLYQFYIAINAVETRFLTLPYSKHKRRSINQFHLLDHFPHMQHISNHHLSIYFTYLYHNLEQNLNFINPC